jgi:hypothetical protein
MRGAATVAFVCVLISPSRGGEGSDFKEPTPAAGSLRGVVVFKSGDVVHGADVRLSPSGGAAPQRTDNEGAFFFKAIPPGTYTVEVRCRQIEDAHRAETKVQVPPRETVKVRVALSISPKMLVRVLGEGRRPIPSKVSVRYNIPKEGWRVTTRNLRYRWCCRCLCRRGGRVVPGQVAQRRNTRMRRYQRQCQSNCRWRKALDSPRYLSWAFPLVFQR